MFKKLLKFIGIVFIYIVLNSISFSLLPFSADFKAQNMASGPSALPFVLISTCWIVFTMIYIINNCEVKGKRLTISAIVIIFFVSTVLTQLETLFFGDAFKGLLKKDILMICLANLIPVLVSVITAALLFKRKDDIKDADQGAVVKIDVKKSIKAVLVIGVVYAIVYFSFGYFVAWRFEAVRLFYSGSAADSGFIDKLISNWNDASIIYPFQYFRGVLFACCGLGLLSMKWKHMHGFVISLCLVYLCTAIQLIVPNFLFPDAVRWAHFLEMSSSMLLFGIITSVLLWKCRKG